MRSLTSYLCRRGALDLLRLFAVAGAINAWIVICGFIGALPNQG